MKLFLLRCVLASTLLGFCSSPLFSQSFSLSTPVGSPGVSAWADGSNNNSRFAEPTGVAVDSNGIIYVADAANHIIRQITRSGSTWLTKTIAGLPGTFGNTDGTNSDARFYFPHGVAVDPLTRALYVADTYNHLIRKVTPSGTNWVVTTFAGSAGAHGSSDGIGTSAFFYYPSGITVDSQGIIYVADSYNHTIRRISANRFVLTIAGTAGISGVVNGTNTAAQFDYPSGIIADTNGNLFIADTYNCMIREMSLLGSEWVTSTLSGLPRYPGSADGTNRFAQFNYPFGIAVSSSGTLYVADTLNDTIRALTPIGSDWVVTTIGGQANIPGTSDGAGAAALFNNPYGIAVDRTGSLLISDSLNYTIRFGQTGVTLQAALYSGQLVLSWPVTAAGYVLETASALAGASWTTVSGVVVSSNNFVKTNATTAPQAFFRLHSQ